MRTIKEQLLEAFEESGMSVTELAEKAGIERSMLHKRLKADVHPLRTGGSGYAEPEAIARALGGSIVFVPAGSRVVVVPKKRAA